MRNKIVYIKIPNNVNRSNSLYQDRSYSICSLKILEINDIEVTYDGICFKNNKIIKESVQGYPDKLKIFELESRLKFLSNPFLSLPEDLYLLVHHPWVNYYHWLTEIIPRIWLVKGYLSYLTLILPQYFRHIEFIQESLKPFDFKNIYYFEDGYNLRIKNAVIPQIKPFCYSYDPQVLKELRIFYITFAKRHKAIDYNLGNKLYIMRGNSNRRKIINEDLLIKNLKKYEFKPIVAQNFTFYEQVMLSNNTDFLISNGSGLTNMHFMKEGASVLELKKKLTNINDFHDRVLWHMASALNLNYYSLQCDPVDKKEDIYTADLKVDMHKIDKIINKMLRKKIFD